VSPSVPPLRDHLKPRPYRHRRPRRPKQLPFRREPPPERSRTPDMSWFLYIGIALVIILLVLAIPYIIQSLVEILSS
jgi:hypothetical protein